MHFRHTFFALCTALLIGVAHTGLARADEANSGTTTGVVVERSTEFLLVQAPGDLPRRHWLKWADAANLKPDPAIESIFESINVGDEVEVRWTDNGRRDIESMRVIQRAALNQPATQPARLPSSTAAPPAAANPVPTVAASTESSVSPSTQPAADGTPPPNPSTRSTLGETVNALIDNLLAVGSRLMELPISLILGVVIVVGGLLLGVAHRVGKAGRVSLAARLRVALVVIGFLFVTFLFDRKVSLLQADVDAIRSKMNENALATLDKKSDQVRSGRPFMFDPAQAQQLLAANFKDVALRPSPYDAATDVVQIRIGSPLVQAYLAIVDLSNPAVQIKLGTDLDQKSLTSAFAKQNDCSLAINGEAGSSPDMDSGLGVWRGNMIYQGQIVSREDARNPRPFIAFDPMNRGYFTSAATADRTLPTDMPTLIWGRLDSITNGVVQTADERYRQPRTAMGVSQDGTRLYLLVVDGRQQRYSVGVTRAEVGYLLKAFGAYNAMMCDEGGSSCIYLKQFGGISNIPSDNQGEERPTYTHFGITLHEKS